MSINEYYWFPIAGDTNVGSGFGTLKGKGLGKDYQMGGTYPYDDYLLDPEDDDDDEDIFDDVFGDDPDTSNKFMQKINRKHVSPDPGGVGVGKRYDMRSTTTNQRFDIATLSENQFPEMRSGDSLYGTLSPIPFKSLYKKFEGPAVGGFSTMASYKTGPFKGLATEFGITLPPMAWKDDELRLYHLEDILTPGDRAYTRAQQSVNRVK